MFPCRTFHARLRDGGVEFILLPSMGNGITLGTSSAPPPTFGIDIQMCVNCLFRSVHASPPIAWSFGPPIGWLHRSATQWLSRATALSIIALLDRSPHRLLFRSVVQSLS